MIDRRAYCETFSQLRASGDAKREALERMRHQRIKKKPRPLRVLGLTAAVVAALCVTAGAVNLATDGALFRQLRVVWQDDTRLELQDAEGNRVSAALVGENLVTREEGRLILHAGGEDMDITDAMAARGYYHYAYDMTVIHGDGAQELRTITIDVTGDLDGWIVTQNNGDGTAYTVAGGDARAN